MGKGSPIIEFWKKIVEDNYKLSSEKDNKIMFLHDRAIQNNNDDLLNRTYFSDQLAKSIINWKENESIVIGLFGPWGSGKTSVINLTLNKAQNLVEGWKEEDKPIIIWFNPWSFTERDQLLRAFFQQVLSKIHEVDPKTGKKLRDSLNKFARILGAISDVPVIGKYAGAGGQIFEIFTKERSLRDEKKHLDKLFKDLNRRIIIILDDIDRLTNEEIRLLFQTIKINADFPNTLYLAAFDRIVVEKALTSEQGINGQDYLEKIIQVGFNLPKIDQTLIQDYFFSELDKALSVVEGESFDRERWTGLIQKGFLKLFTSLRDVKRYVNGFKMTIDLIHHEIDLVDFIGLEAIRVFLPNVYEKLAENKYLFLVESRAWDNHDKEKQAAKDKLEEIFSSDGEENSSIAKEILRHLFPQLTNIYSNITYAPDISRTWRQEKRICSEYFFDTYFILGTPKGGISQVELDQIVNKTDNLDELIKVIIPYVVDNRFRRLINGLRDRVKTLSEDQSENFILAFVYFLSTLPDTSNELLDLGSDIHQLWLIQELLLHINPENRFNWFKAQLDKSNLSGYCKVVAYDMPRINEPRQDPLFTENELADLKELCIKAINEKATIDSILTLKDFPFILHYWKEWASNNEIIDLFLNEVKTDPKTFWEFINLFTKEQRSQTSGSYKINVKEILDVKGITSHIPKEEIIDCINREEFVKFATNTTEGEELLKLLKSALHDSPL